jgi:molybdenum cofactor biosynthesis enzyme MoaA
MTARVLTFHLTDRCNLNCSHCIRDPGGEPGDLPLDVFERVVHQAGRYGIRQVALTGGEPFLHPQIDRVLDAIVASGTTWHAVTNGSQMERIERLVRDGWCSASMARPRRCTTESGGPARTPR